MMIDEGKLIENVRAHKCLYNPTVDEYKLVHARQAAWQEISRNLKTPIPDCRAKWHQLRNAFLHVLTRRKSTSDHESKTFRKWKYEDEINFLLPYMSQGIWGVGSNSSSLISAVTEINDLDDDLSETQYTGDSSNVEHTPERNKRKVDYHEDLSQVYKAKRQYIGVQEDEINMVHKSITSKNNTQKVDFHEEMLKILKEKVQRKEIDKDEIDLLFESLTKAVKQLPKSEQVKVKIGMTKLIYEAQMRCESQ